MIKENRLVYMSSFEGGGVDSSKDNLRKAYQNAVTNYSEADKEFDKYSDFKSTTEKTINTYRKLGKKEMEEKFGKPELNEIQTELKDKIEPPKLAEYFNQWLGGDKSVLDSISQIGAVADLMGINTKDVFVNIFDVSRKCGEKFQEMKEKAELAVLDGKRLGAITELERQMVAKDLELTPYVKKSQEAQYNLNVAKRQYADALKAKVATNVEAMQKEYDAMQKKFDDAKTTYDTKRSELIAPLEQQINNYKTFGQAQLEALFGLVDSSEIHAEIIKDNKVNPKLVTYFNQWLGGDKSVLDSISQIGAVADLMGINTKDVFVNIFDVSRKCGEKFQAMKEKAELAVLEGKRMGAIAELERQVTGRELIDLGPYQNKENQAHAAMLRRHEDVWKKEQTSIAEDRKEIERLEKELGDFKPSKEAVKPVGEEQKPATPAVPQGSRETPPLVASALQNEVPKNESKVYEFSPLSQSVYEATHPVVKAKAEKGKQKPEETNKPQKTVDQGPLLATATTQEKGNQTEAKTPRRAPEPVNKDAIAFENKLIQSLPKGALEALAMLDNANVKFVGPEQQSEALHQAMRRIANSKSDKDAKIREFEQEYSAIFHTKLDLKEIDRRLDGIYNSKLAEEAKVKQIAEVFANLYHLKVEYANKPPKAKNQKSIPQLHAENKKFIKVPKEGVAKANDEGFELRGSEKQPTAVAYGRRETIEGSVPEKPVTPGDIIKQKNKVYLVKGDANDKITGEKLYNVIAAGENSHEKAAKVVFLVTPKGANELETPVSPETAIWDAKNKCYKYQKSGKEVAFGNDKNYEIRVI